MAAGGSKGARLGAVLRGAEDANLGRRALQAGLVSPADLEGSPRVEELLRARGVPPERIRKLREEIDREEFDLFRPHRRPPPEVEALRGEHDRRLAEFVLVERLGQGGLGEVWKAWDARLGRWVAIKLPAPTPDRESAAKRFTREALAAARLSHPNIVSIHRVAEESGRTFIVMQYVEGRTLSQARPPLRDALETMRTVALAVDYAHAQGVVHRDLKPGNIMIGGDGRAFVLDFGLAHLEDPGRHATRDDLVAGTAAYMSPEQARGDASARAPASDVYGLGATLYELATGRAPFDGGTFAATLEQVLHREPPAPRALNPAVPRDVETVILKAMDKDRLRRYASAREFAEDLDRCRRGEPIAARRTEFGRHVRRLTREYPRAVTAAWAAVVLALLSASLVAVMSRQAERTERDSRVRAARDQVNLALQAALKLRRVGAVEPMAEFRARAEEAWRDAGEGSAELHHLMGRLHRVFLDYPKARELQKKALALDAAYEPALYESAVLSLRSAEAAPGARGCVPEGVAALRIGDLDRARVLLGRAVGETPSAEEAWEALVLAELGRAGPHAPPAAQEEAAARALEMLEKAVALDRGYGPHWVLRGDARAARGTVRKETGRDPLGEFQSAEDDYSEALRLGAGAEALAKRARVRLALAVHRMDLGGDPAPHFASAEEDCRAAARLDPRLAAAPALRARIRRVRVEQGLARGGASLEDCEEGDRAASAAVALDPSLAEAWMERGLLRNLRALAGMAAREDPGAESDLKEAARLAPASPEVWEAWARLRLERARVRPLGCDELGRIRADLDKALERAPFFNAARLGRARVARLHAAVLRKPGEDPGRHFEKAREDLSQVLGANPLSTAAWVEQGHLSLEWGRWRTRSRDAGGARPHYTQAIRSFEEAARLDATLADAFRDPIREARRALLTTP